MVQYFLILWFFLRWVTRYERIPSVAFVLCAAATIFEVAEEVQHYLNASRKANMNQSLDKHRDRATTDALLPRFYVAGQARALRKMVTLKTRTLPMFLRELVSRALYERRALLSEKTG